MKFATLSRFSLVALVSLHAFASSAEMSAAAADYLNHALDLMQQHALHRKEIDWPQLRGAATAYAKDAQTPAETYPAITYACSQLKDHSSHMEEPNGTPVAIERQSSSIEMIAAQSAHGRPLTPTTRSPFLGRNSFLLAMLQSGDRRYAYIVIPYSADHHARYSDPRQRHAWAEDLFHLTAEAKERGALGWVIDLRGNTGGYLAPMLAGLQPLLGDGKVLTLHGPDAKNTLSIKDGAILNRAGFMRVAVEEKIDESPSFDQKNAPVAILLDRGTQSAGESLAIAFEGRKRTLFIGERTAGLTDSGTYWNLSDGAVLSVMSEQVLDRRGHAYPEGIQPETQVEDPKTVGTISEDRAVLRAEELLSRVSRP